MGLSLEMTTVSARNELKQLQDSITKTGTDISGVKKKLETLGKSVSNMAKSFEKAGDSVSAKAYRDLARDIDSVHKSISQVKVDMVQMDSAGKKTAKTMKDVGVQASYAEKSTEKYKRVIENSNKTVEKHVKKNQELAASLKKESSEKKSAEKTARSYDAQLAKSLTTIDATNKKINEVKNKNNELASSNRRLGGAISQLNSKNRELNSELSKITSAHRKAGKTILDYQKNNSKLENQLKRTSTEFRNAKGTISTLEKEVKTLEKSVDKLESSNRKAGKTILDYQKKNSALTNQLNKLRRAYSDAEKTAKSYDRQTAKLMQENERLIKSNEKYKQSLDNVRKSQRSLHDSMNRIMKIASTVRNVMFLAGVATAWKRFADDVRSVGSEFEMIMKQVGGATESIGKSFVTQDFIDLQKTIMSLGEQTEYSSIQAAEAAKHLAMAGFRVGQIQAALKPVMDLATAGQIELAEAAEFSTGALTSMGLITSDTTQLIKNMERVNNALVFSAVQTNVSVEDLAESFKYVAPQARNMGMSIEDLTLWLGVLGNSNIKASAAGTQMSFALMRQAEAMKKLGMATQGSDFLGMLKEMNKQGWGAEQINEVFTARGSRLILSFKNVVPVFERLRDAQKKSNDYAKELAEIMRDTTTVNFQKFSSLINNIKIAGFEKGAKNLNFALKDLYRTVSNNREEFENFAKILVDMEAYAIDVATSIINISKEVKNLYDQHPVILQIAGGFAALAAAFSGHPFVAGAIGTGMFVMNEMGDQVQDLSEDVGELMLNMDKLQKIKEKMDAYEKAKKSAKDGGLFSNYSLTSARSELEEAMSDAGYKYKDKFGKDISYEELNKELTKTESDLKLKKDRLDSLLGLTMNVTNDLAMELAKDSNLTKTFAEEIFAGIRESEDILTRTNEELNDLQSEIDKLGTFGGKIGAKTKGGIKYIGGPTLESQKTQLRKETEDRIKDLESSVQYFYKKANEIQTKYYEENEKFSLLGPRPEVLVSTEEERAAWDKASAEVEKLRINASNYYAAAKNEQEQIIINQRKMAMEGAMLDRQIAQRNYQNLKAGIDAVRASEDEVLNIKKSFFEEYGTWSLKEFKKYNKMESDAAIQAQKDKIADFKMSYALADPASKMPAGKYQSALANMNKSLAAMQKQASIKLALDAARESENRRREEYDAIQQAEDSLYQLKRNNYENYQQWSAQRSRAFRLQEINNEIKAQREVIERLKADRKNKVDKTSEKTYRARLQKENAILNEMERSRGEKTESINIDIFNSMLSRQQAIYAQNKDLDDQLFALKKENAESLDIFSNKNSVKYYKEELDRAVQTEKRKRDLWAVSEMLKSKTDPTKMTDAEIAATYGKWSTLIIEMVKNNGKKVKALTVVTFKDVGDELKSTMESSLSGVFTDALKGELQSFEDYFRSFTDSLSSMWSNMAANMVINQKTLGSLSGLETAGVMGAAGLGIYTISSALSSKEREKAEEARKAALREQLEDELGDAIAQLELSDAEYQIYQLNDRIKELTEQAIDAGYPMEEIIKLRKLETKAILDNVKAQYESASTSMTDFVKNVMREDWTVADWETEYERLHNDLISLDENSTTYQEDSIEYLNLQFEALQAIYSIQKEQLSALEGLDKSLTSQIWDLQNSGNMPTSLENYSSQYEKLFAATGYATGNINPEAVSDFQDFVQEYIDTFAAAGYDYQELVSGVVGDLSDLQIDVQSESERLTAAINANTEALEGSDGVINAINNLANITQEIANKEVYNQWMNLAPSADLSYVTQSTRENAISGGFTGEFGDFSIYSSPYESYGKWGGKASEQELINFSGFYSTMPHWVAWVENGLDQGAIDYDTYTRWNDWLYSIPMGDIQELLTGSTNGYPTKVNEYWDLMDEWVSDKPADWPLFAKGGYATSPSIAGEAGPEWVVPAYNNPNNENFLRSVGIDSNTIGVQIGKIVSNTLKSTLGNISLNADNQGDIVIKMDSKEIGRVALAEIKKNPEPYRKVLS